MVTEKQPKSETTKSETSGKKSLAWQNDPKAGEIQYEDVEAGDFFKFEEVGDFIEGQLLHVSTIKMSNGTVGSYKILTPDGAEMKFNGTVTLDEKLREVPVNTMVKITYIGDERTGSNRKLRQFRVQRQKS